MNEAISILASRKDAAAQIQLRKTELELILANEEADDSEVDKKADALRELLEQNYESRGTHVYQAACDTLAFYYLRNCDREMAAKWYGKELSARKHQSNEGEPRWLRPPDKLMLFYMFASYWNMKGEVVGMFTGRYAVAGKATNVGLAVSSNLIRHVTDRLRKFCGVERGWIGIRTRKPTDEERKAAMVSNLLVVLCSDHATQPVVNTGSLYR